MTEDVLQFIWNSQAFNKSALLTNDGQVLRIFDPGTLNTGSGPDFSEARISIDNIIWSGDIEIHIMASSWNDHHHDLDVNYDRVILHVVWQEDRIIRRSDSTRIPTLELKKYLAEGWHERYGQLMNSISLVPCEAYLPHVDNLVIADGIKVALINRLERKTKEVLETLELTKGDWQRTAIIHLFEGFGFNKNRQAFAELAQVVDPHILSKLTRQVMVEAYLFGLSGLLPSVNSDEYVSTLKQEFDWLNKKYNLHAKILSPTWWKFMRLRPANFPTMRLAQLASFIASHKNFMRSILELDIPDLMNIFMIEQGDFWQGHYHFGCRSKGKLAGLGKESQSNLLINVVAVLLVAYGKSLGQPLYMSKAIQLIETMSPENNRIIRLWKSLGIKPTSAAESQGLIGLFNDYCKKSGCLSCSIGKHILKSQ